MKQVEKLDLILKGLYPHRFDGKSYAIEGILAETGIEINQQEALSLGRRLSNGGYIKFLPTQQGAYAYLTSEGVEYSENDSFTFEGQAIITNTYNIAIINSPGAYQEAESSGNNKVKSDMEKEVFVTYSWDTEDHQLKVLAFFNHLRKNGYHTDIDRKVSQEETAADFIKMMHSAMTDYKKVIIVLSTGYKEKADSFKGGVGTEYGLIIKDISDHPNKYILVSFEGISNSILPLNFI